MTATVAANQRPDLIGRIVYVSASSPWCPVDLDVSAYYAEPEMATVDATGLASAMVGNPLAMQDRMIREGDALTPESPYDVRTLTSSHLKWR
ncbi:hypothetical protein FM21_24510 [Streptomyces mutabilis]|uniref:Uncharacterized protein n=1 Tax=Streptomyces mutabilis TaxID=67332 RepID=A0A086MYH4_9ACTN|nr:hypothetical protein FM21_24510 [Streptomyces mutabilis]